MGMVGCVLEYVWCVGMYGVCGRGICGVCMGMCGVWCVWQGYMWCVWVYVVYVCVAGVYVVCVWVCVVYGVCGRSICGVCMGMCNLKSTVVVFSLLHNITYSSD